MDIGIHFQRLPESRLGLGSLAAGLLQRAQVGVVPGATLDREGFLHLRYRSRQVGKPGHRVGPKHVGVGEPLIDGQRLVGKTTRVVEALGEEEQRTSLDLNAHILRQQIGSA